MKTRTKGNRIQRKAITELESQGFLVAKAEVGGKFVKEKDMFGLFDLCCINPSSVLFVQVTSNVPHTHKNYSSFSSCYRIPSVFFQQWVWFSRQGWKVFDYRNGKKTVIRDDRK